jgi:hypothetical protein
VGGEEPLLRCRDWSGGQLSLNFEDSAAQGLEALAELQGCWVLAALGIAGGSMNSLKWTRFGGSDPNKRDIIWHFARVVLDLFFTFLRFQLPQG